MIREYYPTAWTFNFFFRKSEIFNPLKAAQKKHEAIEMDFAAYKQRINSLMDKAQELEQENYHDIQSIIKV